MELPASYTPDSPMMEQDETPYPCKGCDQILEEGKAFELAGHRWHIDCFRCNTCGTLLDSDANLLLLGDGSLICNNCTYSCSACGNKIEDLAILTGDQAYCASCFRCRSCKRKIENLRYARTTQGMFCMECHDALMARRRKKSAKNQQKAQKTNGAMLLDKSLPSLPPSAVPQSAFSPDRDAMSDAYSDTTPAELPASSPGEKPSGSNNLTLPQTTYRGRGSSQSNRSELDDNTGDGFLIPLALDPNPVPAPVAGSGSMPHELPAELSAPRRSETDTDYFNAKAKQSRRELGSENRSNSASRVPSGQSARSRSPAVEPRGGAAEPREMAAEPVVDTRRRKGSVNVPQLDGTPRTSKQDKPEKQENKDKRDSDGKFQLQEAPKRKKSVSTAKRNSKGESLPSTLDTSVDKGLKSAPASAHVPLREQHVNISSLESPRTSLGAPPHTASPRLSQDRSEENRFSDTSKTVTPEPPVYPKRGDSMQRSGQTPTGVQRKELSGHSKSTSTALKDEPRDATTPPLGRPSLEGNQTVANGGKVISRPMDSPLSKSVLDFPPPRSKDRPSATSESFHSPRLPPQPPTESQSKHKAKASVSSVRSDGGNHSTSPTLPQQQQFGEGLGMTEDMNRIMGGEDGGSFLKRVSNSVRHARSHSDRANRNSTGQKWPRTPLNGTAEGALSESLSSPLLSSPDARDEGKYYKKQLNKERERTAELEKKLDEMESALGNKSNIKQMSKELREKRSTMVVLDTQKEIIFRELETLTEHISSAKKTKEPLDLNNLGNAIVREFASSLEKLKDNFTPQIEELMEKKVNLGEEVVKLNQQKDKALQEFEQLSMKNAQLAELNNNLVHQIGELNKAGGVLEGPSRTQNGLGIYTHHQKDKSNISVDSREMRPSITDSNYTGSTLTAHEHDHDGGAAILSAPRVVNIRKEQPKKTFNWKKGSNVAKGMTKGIKGAFSSEPKRDGTVTPSLEGTPYSAVSNGEPPITALPGRGPTPDNGRQFGFFGQQKKQVLPVVTAAANGKFPTEEVQPPSKLFGAELESRADYERVGIPSIVTKCIQEVELRGMDAEGIYRKSGGAAQVQIIRDGFIQNSDYDISDPDLDITAVTSTLKQYFRKLPTPLITFIVYDMMIDAAQEQDTQERIRLMRAAVESLPQSHHDTLEFLVFHLARVVGREKENLMTSLNCAVVFAPTIMRPESIQREMIDTAAKNNAVQFLIDHCHGIFLGGNGNS